MSKSGKPLQAQRSTLVCNDCKKRKKIDQYAERPNYNNTDEKYVFHICRKCMTKRSKEWRIKNREKFNKYQREYARKKYWEAKKAKQQHPKDAKREGSND